jgi:uncharacterized protein YeaO (DUF488 family)
VARASFPFLIPQEATMQIYTCTVYGYPGLDITVKSGDKVFAPTWDLVMGYKKGRISEAEYRRQYIALMRVSYREHKARWLEVLAMPEVTLCCYCKPGHFCHRTILAELLAAAGKANDIPVELCGERE